MAYDIYVFVLIVITSVLGAWGIHESEAQSHKKKRRENHHRR